MRITICSSGGTLSFDPNPANVPWDEAVQPGIFWFNADSEVHTVTVVGQNDPLFTLQPNEVSSAVSYTGTKLALPFLSFYCDAVPTNTGSINVQQKTATVVSVAQSGSTLTLTASVSATVMPQGPTVIPPTGSVDFYGNGQLIGSAVIAAGGTTASLNYTGAATSFEAQYTGDANNAPSDRSNAVSKS